MTSEIHIDRDGTVVIKTTNRDRLASRWAGLLMNMDMTEFMDEDDDAVDP